MLSFPRGQKCFTLLRAFYESETAKRIVWKAVQTSTFYFEITISTFNNETGIEIPSPRW